MEQAYSILMFIFSGALLLYALLVGMGNADMIPRGGAVKMKDKKAYARQFGKLLSLVALAPLLSGVVGLIAPPERNALPVIFSLVGGVAVALLLGHGLMNDVTEGMDGTDEYGDDWGLF